MTTPTPPPALPDLPDAADPDALYRFADHLTALRMQACAANADGFDEAAVEHFLVALDHLSQAAAHLRLSAVWQARANAGHFGH